MVALEYVCILYLDTDLTFKQSTLDPTPKDILHSLSDSILLSLRLILLSSNSDYEPPPLLKFEAS